MRFVFLLLALALLPLSGRAQCQATFEKYGAGCNSVSSVEVVLSGAFDQGTCGVSLTLGGFPGCCNTYLTSRVFVLGASQVKLPLPGIGPDCVLLASPDVLLVLPSSAGDTLSFQIPRGLPALTIYAQGINIYFTTISRSNDAELSQGLAIGLSG